MINSFSVLLLLLICNGCVSDAKKVRPSVQKLTVQKQIVQKSSYKLERLKRYADSMGCKMLQSGYMVCPKSRNR